MFDLELMMILQNGSPQLTCSLYETCHDTDTLTNTGGQTQPDGSINFITDSDGFCKDTPTGSTTSAPAATSSAAATSTAAATEPSSTADPESTVA